MKYSLLLVVSVAALSLSGCKKAPEPAAQGADNAFNTETPVAAPAASAGQVFADTASASDAFEIQSSRLAATKAQSAKVKRFAEQMIKAHTESTAKLGTAAAAASPAIVPAGRVTPAQQQTLDALASKTGADFDKAYALAQVEGHQATLAALNAYSASGDVPQLKKFATDLIPIVTAHLNMARGL